MMQTDMPLWAGEYGWIFQGQANRCLDEGNLELSEADFASLEYLLEQSELNDDRDDLPLKYCRRAGQPAFRVQNWVGMIRTGSGTHIEILPKISRRSSAEQSRELLVRMLIELEDSPFREASVADLQAHKMPLFELLLSYFLQQVAELVRRGVARSYVQREGNLNKIRGKIMIRENIRTNAANAARFYCEYEEFLADRPINRLIRGGLDITARLTQLPRNQQLCRELLSWFEEVGPSADWRHDFKRIRWDRNVRHYHKALPPCRMLFERLNPLTQQGENRAISMLFPMEKVFEDYVGACLPRQFPGWKVESQTQRAYLVENHWGRPIFALQPDLLLSRNGKSIVADTKWKLIDGGDRANKYGISQTDIYQLFGYLKKLLNLQDRREVWLIYPKHDRFQGPLEPFEYQSQMERLLVLPFDLQEDRLVLKGQEPEASREQWRKLTS